MIITRNPSYEIGRSSTPDALAPTLPQPLLRLTIDYGRTITTRLSASNYSDVGRNFRGAFVPGALVPRARAHRPTEKETDGAIWWGATGTQIVEGGGAVVWGEEKRGTRADGTRIFVERILGSIRADTFNTTIEICLPMTMRTVQPGGGKTGIGSGSRWWRDGLACVGEAWSALKTLAVG